LKRKRVNADDFVLAKKLGHGAFGQVHLVRERGTGKLYALKKILSDAHFDPFSSQRYREEKTVLSETQSPFLTSLKASFQDDECLYLLMEYCAGGDLLRLMTTYDDEKMPEPDVKFYAAEVLMSIAALHAAGYAHRDVKPENVILDAHGHVKMADFGSCIKVGSDGLIRCAMAVGTADYSSPEVLDSMNVKNPTYGRHCDFWALGVLIFEMLHGCLPFNVEEIMSQILKIDVRPHVEFDDKETVISDDAKDLICKLLTKEARRLGRNGVEEIMAHPWFAGITFAELRSPSSVPPFVPALESDDDTQYFERDLLNEAYKVPPRPPPTSTFEPRNLRFHGFSH
ncbi:kinase-like domain-containing protein, partial [Blastocladiella britannica]